MVNFADRTVADISCLAAGVFHLFPSARTVVDIGGQFCRAIKLEATAGRLTLFKMKNVPAEAESFFRLSPGYFI